MAAERLDGNARSCREAVRQEPGGLLTGFEAGMCPHLRVPGTRTGIVPTPMRGLSPCCSSQIVVGALTRSARSRAVLRVPASTSVAVWGLPDWAICTVHSRLGLADGRPGHSIRRPLDDVGELADDRELLDAV
jgi:hypothetical protein